VGQRQKENKGRPRKDIVWIRDESVATIVREWVRKKRVSGR
jgi:hypothetical protein